ncbi:MAG: hypothetical protein KJ792_14760 [Actinobacteria bacterium]|nr:hypothetical protein [Actinomycetota bacterium]MCG2803658.1 hypothetical protein [Cellulomonas sp.]
MQIGPDPPGTGARPARCSPSDLHRRTAAATLPPAGALTTAGDDAVLVSEHI